MGPKGPKKKPTSLSVKLNHVSCQHDFAWYELLIHSQRFIPICCEVLLLPFVGRSLRHPAMGHVDVLQQILELILDSWQAGRLGCSKAGICCAWPVYVKYETVCAHVLQVRPYDNVTKDAHAIKALVNYHRRYWTNISAVCPYHVP